MNSFHEKLPTYLAYSCHLKAFVAKRIALILVTFLISTPALAQQPTLNMPFAAAFAEKFKQLMAGMKAGQCVGPGKADRVAVVGIPLGGIHVSNSLRENINRQAFEALNQAHSFAYRFNDVQNFGQLARLAVGDHTGRQNLQKAVEHVLEKSPYLLMVTTKRPRKNILQLQITLIARGKDQISQCSKSGGLFLRLPDFWSVPPVLDEGRVFVDVGQVYPFILGNFQRELLSVKRLHVQKKFEMDGTCELRLRAGQQFQSSYFSFRRRTAGNFQSDQGDWPDLVLTPPASVPSDKDVATLRLSYSLSRIDQDVVNLSIDLLSQGVLKNSVQLAMLINPAIRAGCTQPNSHRLTAFFKRADKKGRDFELRATRNNYLVGIDPVGIDIWAHEEQHLYCLSIGADLTAYVVYPWKTEQAWPRGTKRRFPDDFPIKKPMRLLKPGKELFGCFASARPLPDELESHWHSLHPANRGGAGKYKELLPKQVRELLKRMEQAPDVGSEFIWLNGVVR